MLSSHQRAVEFRNSRHPRKTKKFCNRCGGNHAGTCQLVATSHGTRVRPDLLATVETRFQESLVAA